MNKNEKIVAGLLVTLLLMCFAMVTLGGYVRLSGSGLSIPEWPFFTIEKTVTASGEVEAVRSVFPPTTEDGWDTLYATLIAELPQYEGIAMSEFKRMFWTEWSHRGLAKMIGVVYLAFMGVALYFPDTRKKLWKLAVGGLVLLVSQAVLGGLVVLFHLWAVKVALHLIVAFLFTGLLLWSLLLLWHKPSEHRGKNPILWWAIAVSAIIAFQIFSGGLMAGSLAGYQMNTWPKMGEVWVPNGLNDSSMGFFENFTENVIMIQFFHRWFAFLAALSILAIVFRCMTVQVSRPARWALRAMFGIIVLQIILGIYTLLMNVHTHLALTHQLVGLILLMACFFLVYETAMHPVKLEEALAKEAEQRDDSAAHGKAALNA